MCNTLFSGVSLFSEHRLEILLEQFRLLCVSSSYFVIEENLLWNMVGFGQRFEVFLELLEPAFLEKLCFIAMLIFLKGSH